jgi:hypothetical protein
MKTPTYAETLKLALAAGEDAGNRHMRRAGRAADITDQILVATGFWGRNGV